ncbi:MAG: hypothetical protein K1X55_16070 [Chitinophagales bacterium]|nr:hypothetical protein [Chitinophagales bacterium]
MNFRMLNPDNFVQVEPKAKSRFIGNATSTQAYNRYSYVVNNPLKYTDPSGWLRNYITYDDILGHQSLMEGLAQVQAGMESMLGSRSGFGGSFIPNNSNNSFQSSSEDGVLYGKNGVFITNPDIIRSIIEVINNNDFNVSVDYLPLPKMGNEHSNVPGFCVGWIGTFGVNGNKNNTENTGLGSKAKDETNILVTGKITFVNFPKLGLLQYAIIPESGSKPRFVEKNGTYNVDGYYFPNPTDDKFWYKIPGTYHLTLTWIPKSDGTFEIDRSLTYKIEADKYGYLSRNGIGEKHRMHKYNPFLKTK